MRSDIIIQKGTIAINQIRRGVEAEASEAWQGMLFYRHFLQLPSSRNPKYFAIAMKLAAQGRKFLEARNQHFNAINSHLCVAEIKRLHTLKIKEFRKLENMRTLAAHFHKNIFKESQLFLVPLAEDNLSEKIKELLKIAAKPALRTAPQRVPKVEKINLRSKHY